MTQPVATSPRVPALALRARASAPQGSGAAVRASADTVALSDQAAITWARGSFMKIPHMTRQELETLAGEASAKAATPGLGGEARGICFLARSGALGKLALMKVSRKSNGKASYEALRQAVALAPTDRDVTQAYARGMYAIADRNFFIRKIVSSTLGMDLKANLREGCTLLAQFPNDPTSQAVRLRIADKVDDKQAQREAQAHLDRMAKYAPQAVADALRKLDGDKGMAKAAEADEK